MKPTERTLKIQYAIADMFYPARQLEKRGIDVIRLNIGDPNRFDFSTPQHIRDALSNAAQNASHAYTETEGLMELREAIVERERRESGVHLSADDVFVTAGVTEALQMTMASVLDEGDEFLVPGPTYPPYNLFIKFFGGTPVSYRTIEEEDWRPDLDDLRDKIGPRTKGVSIINPNNPTGAVYSKKVLQEMVDIVGEHDLFLISDEIYDLMTFDGEHHSVASLADDVPVMIFNGFSKVFLVPGWRVGYVAFCDKTGMLDEIKASMVRQLGLRISANAPCQHACVEALNGPNDFLEENREKLRKRADLAYKRFNEIPGLSTRKPRAAFYIFPRIEADVWESDKDFVLDVLKSAHLLFVPGSGFCEQYGKGHFRSVLLPEIEVLEKAFDSLEQFMNDSLP